MPNYDFKCRLCSMTFEANVPSHVRVINCIECISVDKLLVALADRLPSAPSFTVTGFNAANGYSNDPGR